jgi:hypothetical protein
MFIAQINVTADYIVFFFARKAEGDYSNGVGGFWDREHFTVQDPDNPSQFYEPVSAQRTSNGSGAIWTLSFNRFPMTRFKLTCRQPYSDNPPMVFEEITVGEPDK